MADETPIIDLRPKQETHAGAFAVMVLVALIIVTVIWFTFYFSDGFITRKSASIPIDTMPDASPNEGSSPKVLTGVALNFFPYIHEAEAFVDKNLSLYGFCGLYAPKSITGAVYTPYLVDDAGRRIELADVPNDMLRILPRDNASSEIYHVTGTMQRSYSTYYLRVDSIVISKRPGT